MTGFEAVEARLDAPADAQSLLGLAEEVLESWVTARGQAPTDELREGFRRDGRSDGIARRGRLIRWRFLMSRILTARNLGRCFRFHSSCGSRSRLRRARGGRLGGFCLPGIFFRRRRRV